MYQPIRSEYYLVPSLLDEWFSRFISVDHDLITATVQVKHCPHCLRYITEIENIIDQSVKYVLVLSISILTNKSWVFTCRLHPDQHCSRINAACSPSPPAPPRCAQPTDCWCLDHICSWSWLQPDTLHLHSLSTSLSSGGAETGRWILYQPIRDELSIV